jgi:hypothetical protein
MAKKIYKETYFQHDRYARQDPKIKNLLAHFRKDSEDRAKSAVLIYWWIIEDMHIDDYPVDKIEAFADDYRCEVDFLRSILEDFELFRVENGFYISDRVLRNMEQQGNKLKQRQTAASSRWLLSAFNKCYEKEFGETPTLDCNEIETLKKYSSSVEGFKEKLPDVIYTLKNLKFPTDMTFVPTAHWLLKDNNFTKLIDGEFGKLKHRKSKQEIKREEKERELEKAEQNKPSELELEIEKVQTRAEALELIIRNTTKSKLGLFINPNLVGLQRKFNISKKDIEGA